MLSEKTLTDNFIALFRSAKTTPMSEQEFAEELATIINAQIKTATVTVTGITSGSGTATGSLL